MKVRSTVVVLMTLQWSLLAAFGTLLFILPTRSFFPAQSWVGAGLIILGFVMFVLAIIAHRSRNRDVMIRTVPIPHDKAELVSGGIYGFVRHPMYLATVLAAIGAAIARGQAWLLVFTAVIAIHLYVKSRYEERLLRARYPTYREYMNRTGRIIPRFRRVRRRNRS